MEGRAHKPWQYSSGNDRPSPMQQDLLKCLNQMIPTVNATEDAMIRRILPAGCTPRVCVVGAGMAGLRCAEVLTKKGAKVTLLEARNRIGGRVGQLDLTKVEYS